MWQLLSQQQLKLQMELTSKGQSFKAEWGSIAGHWWSASVEVMVVTDM
jgi:hypothetical protein